MNSQIQEVRQRLQEVEQLRLQGKLDKAERLGTELVRKNPYYLAALHTLGLVYLDKKNFERSLDCLVRALMCDPNESRTLAALGLVYRQLGALELSEESLAKAARLAPNDASILTSLGELMRAKQDEDAAIEFYRRALAVDPALETAEIGLSSCLMNFGQFSEAADVLDRSVARGQRSLNILHLMANLPRGFSKFDAVGELEKWKASSGPLGAAAASDFAFAYAAALDQADRYEEAWKRLTSANRRVFDGIASLLSAQVALQSAALKRLQDAQPKAAEIDPRYPTSLFILGPSRSGKTSLENLLRNFDGVKTGCENPIVEAAMRKTCHMAGIPGATLRLEQLPSELVPSFRSHYLEALCERAGGASVFSITDPGRILDISIIARTVPNVRIVLVRRDQDDNALRIFMTRYRDGNAHAYSMGSIRSYLDWYATMQELVEKRFPAIVTSVRYEDMVADPAKAASETARHCGILNTPISNHAVYDDRGRARNYLPDMERD